MYLNKRAFVNCANAVIEMRECACSSQRHDARMWQRGDEQICVALILYRVCISTVSSGPRWTSILGPLGAFTKKLCSEKILFCPFQTKWPIEKSVKAYYVCIVYSVCIVFLAFWCNMYYETLPLHTGCPKKKCQVEVVPESLLCMFCDF